MDETDEDASEANKTVKPTFQEVSLQEEVSQGTHEAASSDSEDAMYSVGSTPAGTPVKVPKGQTLSPDECQLLVQMESQNELLQIKESYEKKIQDLETSESLLQDKIQSLEKQLTTCQEDFEKTITEVKKSLTSKLEQAVKQAESAKKDMESMVIKYAMSERHVIEAKKIRETSEQKVKDVLKDKESLLGRIKALTNDKTSLTTALDRKITEHALSLKEVDRLNSELKAKDLILKETQQKLQHSSNCHEELKEQLVNLNNVMEVLRNELETCKQQTAKSLEQEQHVEQEVNRIQELEVKLKIGLEEVEASKKEMESLKSSHESQVKQLEASVSERQDQLLVEKQKNEDLLNQLKQMEGLQQELQTDLETHRHKDEEMADLNERLKEKICVCQAEIERLSQENSEVKNQMDSLRTEKQSWEKKEQELNEQLTSLRRDFDESCKEYEEKLSDKLKTIDSLKSKIDELENDKRIMSKKHANAMRELTKELHRKKQEMMSTSETSSLPIPSLPMSDRLSATSRTSSSSSLDVLHQGSNGEESIPTDQSEEGATYSSANKKSVAVNGTSSEDSSGKSVSHEPSSESLTSLPELSRQSLIDRILKLQKMLNKKSEKMDFLEDHNRQLLEELKKKTRLIQYYLLREETGALTTAEMDKNKRELLKKGATTMSSLYKNAIDSEMTLELSLEINRKLQAVLEDTILKNITLKESISTLGDEVARLSRKSLTKR